MKLSQKLVKFIILKTQIIPLEKLTPAEWNPRIITDKRFKDLCDSISSDPQFLVTRPMLASKNGILYAGNMRYRALMSLGYTEGPVIYTDIDEKTAKLRAIKDNTHFGEFQMDELSTMVVDFSPLEVKMTGLPENIIKSINGAEGKESPKEFVQFDASIDTDFQCPKCSYVWSGKAK